MELSFHIYVDDDTQSKNMDKLHFHPDTFLCNSHISKQNSSDTNVKMNIDHL